MRTVASEQVLERLQWRYATKKFEATRKIPADVWSVLEQSAILSPSSFGLQPWKFIVVDDPALRETLRAKAWNQAQVTDASHLVVFARRTSVDRAYVQRVIDRMAEVRHVPPANLNGYRDMMLGFVENAEPGFDDVWNSRQVYIALGFFLSACAMMGVDACPIEGFEPAAFDEILGLGQDGYAATVIAAAGYRASDDATGSAAKVRFIAQELIEYR